MLFIKKKAKEAEMEKMKAVEAEQPKPETVRNVELSLISREL